jgi:hypothetical protein
MMPVTIFSEGTRLAADLIIPDDLPDGDSYPAVLRCHGWATV